VTKSVLVTGGTGFVAGWCIVELLRRGYTVRTTVRSQAKERIVRETISSFVESDERLSVFIADLNLDDGWELAMDGCDSVLHVASPLGISNSLSPEELVATARDGTIRVLGAARNVGVRRVVMTSAAAAATPPLQDGDSFSDESVWFDPYESQVDAYRQSKRMAEKAAWDFMRTCDCGMALTTILPGAVFGPALSTHSLGSMQVIERLLQGRVPATPRLAFEVVDARDLADLHIRAMESELAAGERLLAVGELMWMSDIAHSLREHLGPLASKVPTRALPDFVFRLLSLLDPSLRAMAPRLGREIRHTSQKARALLGWQPRSAVITLIDGARSLLQRAAS
jgi:dihydroflavonol-4-reductase